MKYANKYFKLVKKYISRVGDNGKLLAEIFSLKKDIEMLNKNHEKEIKELEKKIKELELSNETQLKRNEILRRDNVGMYHLVKKYQKKLGIERTERRVFK
jgi:hypothetical protein